ncbi:MAG: sporulation protein YabP [Clostridia bacterium]|nr:sporulation protein YabP [Clostridia bacterium]
MSETIKKENKEHTLMLDNRKKLSVTGVVEVVSATDKTIVAKTIDKTLFVVGTELRVSKLNLEETLLMVEGVVDTIKYQGQQTKGLLKRVFR